MVAEEEERTWVPTPVSFLSSTSSLSISITSINPNSTPTAIPCRATTEPTISEPLPRPEWVIRCREVARFLEFRPSAVRLSRIVPRGVFYPCTLLRLPSPTTTETTPTSSAILPRWPLSVLLPVPTSPNHPKIKVTELEVSPSPLPLTTPPSFNFFTLPDPREAGPLPYPPNQSRSTYFQPSSRELQSPLPS